ncbi:MAG: hypothetical protein F4Z06_11635 [Acidimicrobiia bacterium]|nr:hypothetical protein [Acidimicrobiia bacterium]MYE74078.1 hypothetical protein [Acidimicrobiia bacterium]MYJ61040.1 hypothetical protein [Acidimicrobiia bacterium]
MLPQHASVKKVNGFLQPDAEAVNCVAQVGHAHTICQRGASADCRLATYRDAQEEDDIEDESLSAIVPAAFARIIAPPDLVLGAALVHASSSSAYRSQDSYVAEAITPWTSDVASRLHFASLE